MVLEEVHQIRVLTVLAEDLGSVFNTHIVAYYYRLLQIQRIQYPFLTSVGSHVHMVYMHTLRRTSINKINIFKFSLI